MLWVWHSSLIAASTAAKQPQQHQEQIDEIQVQGQSAVHCHLFAGIGLQIATAREGHHLQLLGVIGSQGSKNDHTNQTDHKSQRAAVQKDIDHHSHNQANQSHHHQVAHAGQVGFGGVTNKAHGPKHGGAADKGGGNG